jgi:hypothetical protein
MSDDASNRRIGAWVAGIGVAIGIAYVATGLAWLLQGGLSSANPYRPPDPFMAILEILIVLSTAVLVVLMATIHATAPAKRRVFSLSALAFTSMFAVLTSGVHFIWLTVLRQTPIDAVPAVLRPDPWPSMLIAVDMLAWGPVLGIALLAAAPVFTGGGTEKAIRFTLGLGGMLSLAGVLGPATGDLRFWWFAMADYVAVLPVLCLLLAIHFAAFAARQD